jgi:hypothetical protein
LYITLQHLPNVLVQTANKLGNKKKRKKRKKSVTKLKNKLCGLSPREKLYRPSDSSLSAKSVPTFADIGCRVVSAMDSHSRILDFCTKATSISSK